VQSVLANSGDQVLERNKVFAYLPNCHHYELFGVQFVNDLKTQDVQLASCYQTLTEKSLDAYESVCQIEYSSALRPIILTE
jgi:hypothetical protein